MPKKPVSVAAQNTMCKGEDRSKSACIFNNNAGVTGSLGTTSQPRARFVPLSNILMDHESKGFCKPTSKCNSLTIFKYIGIELYLSEFDSKPMYKHKLESEMGTMSIPAATQNARYTFK